MNRITRIFSRIETAISPFITNGIKVQKAIQDVRFEHLVKYYSSLGQTIPELRFQLWRIQRNRTGFYSLQERMIHIQAIEKCLGMNGTT